MASLRTLALFLVLLLSFARSSGAASPAEGLFTVTDETRCPVCGMLVARFPLWLAQVRMSDGSQLAFDGVKDMAAYVLQPQSFGAAPGATATDILVKDYYSQRFIDGKKAWYVIGSDVLGPMGHEFIPFAEQSQAETFLDDHRGKRILGFDDIDQTLVDKLRLGHKMKHRGGMAKP